ncbi:hypothetical protein TSUD_181800 [Trifolium subterraneum]|uniref:Uncharacterized protein n=1 Tax=Trifolium subterraneum TaxID=3900 RepID=A0A2Z6P4E1_TRISU|nr:hypothetical protein TSUD_181800 [Trifolium subterraneum]
MELHYYILQLTVLFLTLFPQSLNCQQVYLNNTVFDCTNTPSVPKGYLCNGHKKSCTSFLVFKSKHPYDNPTKIAYLLGSEASTIASINKISINEKIPSNKSVIVPVLCSCAGNIYQHSTSYSVMQNDTYFELVKETYQGLTTCQAMMGQNYYAPIYIPVGAELTVPVLCACPTANLTARGVTSLLVHIVNYGDTVKSIGEAYGVGENSMREANELPLLKSANSSVILYASTPILVPLRGKSCKENPERFYCKCSEALHADGSSEGLFCDESHGQKIPAKLVVASGIFV